MTEPAYVAIARDYAQRIRNGTLPAGTQLPSFAEMAERAGVSQIVIRQAVTRLLNQGLVRTVERRGTFVADHSNLARVAPGYQIEGLGTTFEIEGGRDIQIEREIKSTQVTPELAKLFGLAEDAEMSHVITRSAENGKPISISDTYSPMDAIETSAAAFLEETVADQLPTPEHAAWLRVSPGQLVKTVRQRFLASNERVLMISDVSYPRDRYGTFVFRMAISSDNNQDNPMP